MSIIVFKKMHNNCSLEEIDSIKFSLQTEKDILKKSVVEITSSKLYGANSVYDGKLGKIDNEPCLTCNNLNCPGHFGHINLNSRVCNPLYYKTILQILKSVCYRCSRLLISKERVELNGLKKNSPSLRFHAITKFVEKVEVCSYCSTYKAKFLILEKNFYIQTKNKVPTNDRLLCEKIPISDDDIYKIFSNIPNEDVNLLGFSSDCSPKDLIFTVLPVLPPISRPWVKTDGIICDDDLTLQYTEIVKTNLLLQKQEINEFRKDKLINTLKFRIRSLFDNSNEKQRVTNGGRALRGIKTRLSGKEGLIRSNIMGKRVNFSGRSVIGGDPFLKVNEIGIPFAMAKNLSYSEKVNRYNIDRIREDIKNGRVNYILRKNNGEISRINALYATKSLLQNTVLIGDVIYRRGVYFKMITKETEKFEINLNIDKIYRNGELVEFKEKQHIFSEKEFEVFIGDSIERHLKNGDYLFLNRQPTLHSGSMIGQRIKLLPKESKTIRLNLAITTTFNADFDGDEMNLHCPSSIDADNELRSLSSMENFILNPQHSQANIVLVQDTVLAMYRMTLKKHQYPYLLEHIFFQILGSLENFDIDLFHRKKKIYKKYFANEKSCYTGRMLVSILLPEDFFFEKENKIDEIEPILKIKEGIVVSGALNKKDINKIVQLLYIEYDVNICMSFLNNAQFLSTEYLLHTSFSVGIKDCMTYNKEQVQNGIAKALLKSESVGHNIRNKRIEEIYTRFALLEARDLGLKLSKENLLPDNNFLYCVRSGAKGALFNLLQITSLLGQQEVSGSRIKPCLNNNSRVLPHFPLKKTDLKEFMSQKQKGFITSCFLDGLDPIDYYLHSMTGREGILDTSMKTSSSGYVQRRLIKLLEDYIIEYDGTVRKSDGRIVQFVYGNHLNPSEAIVIDGKLQIVDISRIITKIKHNIKNNISKTFTNQT